MIGFWLGLGIRFIAEHSPAHVGIEPIKRVAAPSGCAAFVVVHGGAGSGASAAAHAVSARIIARATALI